MTTHKLAIITRTKDREITLERAKSSVLVQTCREFTWVLVNDGGAKAHVDRIATEARQEGLDVRVIHHSQSLGRPAAANAGIEACREPYLLLHDDDDSLHPSFVAECLGLLDRDGAFYGGVVTHSNIVNEDIRNGSIVRLAEIPGYHPSDVNFSDLFYTNLFPPISFIFCRDGWEKAGKFRSFLNYSEDWNFNQNFLAHYSIAVIPRVLAYYHHRETISRPGDIYANTMVAGQLMHKKYKKFWMEQTIRQDIAAGHLGLGELNLRGEMYLKLQHIEWTVCRIEKALADHQRESLLAKSTKRLRNYARRAIALQRDGKLILETKNRLSRWLEPHNEAVAVVEDNAPGTDNVLQYECAACGAHSERFVPLPEQYVEFAEAGGRFTCADLETMAVETYHCPVCYAADRDRLMALYFRRLSQSLDKSLIYGLLEFAPRQAFTNFIRAYPFISYRSCDLYMKDVDDHYDITDLSGYARESFDFVVCSHVLEHVEDDIAAMAELYRVLKPGGKALVLVPIYRPLEECY